MESVHYEGLLLGSLNPPDDNNPKRGNPKPEKNFWFWKLISSILTDVEILAEFTVKLPLK